MACQNALKAKKVLNILLNDWLKLPNLGDIKFVKIVDTKVGPILFYLKQIKIDKPVSHEARML